MEVSEAKLIAYLLSDGGIYKGGDNGLYIFLTSKDKTLINDFKEILVFYGLKPYVRLSTRAYEIRVGNKKLAQKLLNKCKTFRTLKYSNNKYPEIEIPKEILTDKKLAKEFLKVFASCEGYVKFNKRKWTTRRITIGCSHPELSNYLIQLIGLLGISTTKRKTEVVISGKENIVKFQNEIGFIKGTKVQKGKFTGLDKEYVLHKMLDSYRASLRAKHP